MKTTQLNQCFMRGISSNSLKSFIVSLAFLTTSGIVYAQDIEEIRWKSESQVRALYGEPESISVPVGTHASYTLWKYEDFTVAFANNRAFHLFKKDSLRKFELEEDRNDS